MNKKELEKKKEQKRKEKLERKEKRKNDAENKSAEDMFAYVDEYGRITSTPPDPTQKEEIEIDDIAISTPKMDEIDDDSELKGIIDFFNEDKGFGFIKDLKNPTRSYFFHINNALEPIVEGNKVTFELEKGKKGMNAINISLLKEQPKNDKNQE